ncbi:hypothetical protein Tco_0449728, partial [Tanacetum coccineum]
MPGGSLLLLRETLAESSPTVLDVDDDDLDLGERNIKQCKRKICDGHYTVAVRVLSSSGVAPYTDVVVFDELVSSITHVVNLFLGGNYPLMLGEYIASPPLTPLVKPGGGIRPIAFGVGVSGGSEAILHSVNHFIESCGDDVGLSMLLVDFKNAFNLVDREHTLWSCQGVQQGDPLGLLLFAPVLHPLICKIRDSFSLSLHAWYLDDGTIVGDTLVVGKVLELIMEDGPGCGLHLNVDKTEVFLPKEDPQSRLAGISPPNIARPLHGVKLLGGTASVDFNFCNALVMKLYFTMCTCPPRIFESAQRSFDVALRSSLERI